MCDPVSATLAVGTAVSLAGSYMQTQASQKQSNAISAQNQTLSNEQNEAFNQRIQAGFQQTAAQTAASQQTLADRSAASAQTQQSQMSALKNYQDTLNAENTQAASLRSTGDQAAQGLLTQTSAPNLAAAQTAQQQQAAALLAGQSQGGQNGPQVTDPSGNDAAQSDSVQQGAMARRTAEAATNIRNYGAKVGQVQSYQAPLTAAGLAISNNQSGIMPAQAADQLLRSGSGVRLLPTQVAYNAATGQGQTLDMLLQSRGQNALDAASLSYGNATDLANLQQGDVDTIAKNRLAQQTADIANQKAQAGVISGVGNLALQGAGYYGGSGVNSYLSSLFGSGGKTPAQFEQDPLG